MVQSQSWILPGGLPSRAFTCPTNSLPFLCHWGKGENTMYSDKYVLGSLALQTVMCLPRVLADTCFSLDKPVLDGCKAQGKSSWAGSWSNKLQPGWSTKIYCWAEIEWECRLLWEILTLTKKLGINSSQPHTGVRKVWDAWMDACMDGWMDEWLSTSKPVSSSMTKKSPAWFPQTALGHIKFSISPWNSPCLAPGTWTIALS